MSDYDIQYTQASYNDIVQIGHYISYSLLEPDISKRFIKELLISIRSLSTFPYRYPLIHNIKKKYNLHCKPFKTFYIFYSVNESLKEITIIRVLYNKRDWGKIV